ncbi:hypothetical protein MTYM_01716 [Methylococcales bacterium]|nr:hypothetical protein MTYM_01716 [Methylococcales bacterium]
MKKLTKQAEAYAILREAGKSVQDAYKLAGYKGNPKGTAAYQLEKRVKSFSLVDPDMLEKGHSVAKLTLKIAEKVLKDRDKQKLSVKEEICLKKAHELYLEQQKRTSPVVNRNVNVNVDIGNSDNLVDLSAYRNNTESGEENCGQVINAEFTQQES